MKKIFALFALVIILAGGYFGYTYYHDTYVGETAYAKIPSTVVEKKEHESQSSIGDNSPWYSYDYPVTYVKEDGSTKKDTLSVSGDNPTPLDANSYVKVKISKKRILEGPNTVSESEIPEKVLTELNKTNQ